MKALNFLKSAINQSSFVGVIALVLLIPVLFPKLAFADDQTSGSQAQIFKINITDPSVLNPNNNQNSLTIDSIEQADPLNVDLQAYLQDHNSPLQSYTTQLLSKPNWKEVVAISFVESNMCVHNLNYNCSGIGGPGHFYAFTNFGGWIDCMSNLLTTRYSDKTLAQMNGVYVQPASANWLNGSTKVYNELTALEQTANQQRVAMAQASVNTTSSNQELATIAQ